MARMSVEERVRKERERAPERMRAAEREKQRRRTQPRVKPLGEPTERRKEESGRYLGIDIKPGELSTPRKREALRKKRLKEYGAY